MYSDNVNDNEKKYYLPYIWSCYVIVFVSLCISHYRVRFIPTIFMISRSHYNMNVTHTHVYTRTYTHTYPNINEPRHQYVHFPTHTNVHIPTCPKHATTYIYAYAPKHQRTYTHTLQHTHAQAYIYTHATTRTHVHIHTRPNTHQLKHIVSGETMWLDRGSNPGIFADRANTSWATEPPGYITNNFSP